MPPAPEWYASQAFARTLPLVEVVRREPDPERPWYVLERLACGHVLGQPPHLRPARRRRCWKCGPRNLQ